MWETREGCWLEYNEADDDAGGADDEEEDDDGDGDGDGDGRREDIQCLHMQTPRA
jgi:hypothetical protein